MRKKLTFFGTIVLLLLCYVIYPCVWPVAGMMLYVAYITIVGFDKKTNHHLNHRLSRQIDRQSNH